MAFSVKLKLLKSKTVLQLDPKNLQTVIPSNIHKNKKTYADSCKKTHRGRGHFETFCSILSGECLKSEKSFKNNSTISFMFLLVGFRISQRKNKYYFFHFRS